MWFRGVATSVGLCFDFGAVLEGHPDVVLVVNGDVVHHRQPVCFPELRHSRCVPLSLRKMNVKKPLSLKQCVFC